MRDDFFSFDDLDEPVISNSRSVFNPTIAKTRYLPDPRDCGGVLLERRDVSRAKCSICEKEDLTMEVFYFEGKMRKFVRCKSCDHYLFELERRRKY